MTREVFVVDAVRTPIGRYGGALAGVRPDDLAPHVVRALVERRPGLDPAAIDDVCFGDANGAGEDNRNVARMAVLLAGLPPSVPGATVNRLCGSGMEAVIEASRAIAVGDADVVLAGGVESMSRAPVGAAQARARPIPAGTRSCARPRSAGGWSTRGCRRSGRSRSARAPRSWPSKYGITREAQDEFALRSHRQAAAAWAGGASPPRWCRWPASTSTRDECIRPDTTLEALAGLRPAFRPDGTVTAGNSSPAQRRRRRRRAGSADEAWSAGAGAPAGPDREPGRGRRRAAAVRHRAGRGRRHGAAPGRLGLGRPGAVELNEAFAAQSLACLAEWPELDPAIVNPHGGAIAIGHPLGCSGARILGTLAHQLARTGGRYGLAAMCIGVGQGIAVVVENLRR